MERSRESEAVFDAVTKALVCRAVEAGWREAEAAMALADAAERYVVYLATNPKRSWTAANSN